MRAWKFGDNVNTDEIIPSRHNITTDENKLVPRVGASEYAENLKQIAESCQSHNCPLIIID